LGEVGGLVGFEGLCEVGLELGRLEGFGVEEFLEMAYFLLVGEGLLVVFGECGLGLEFEGLFLGVGVLLG
jgi:hypothetical protein